MKICLDIPFDTEAEIVLKSLKSDRQDLSTTKSKIFSDDRKKDKKLISEHVKALDLIIKYYSIKE